MGPIAKLRRTDTTTNEPFDYPILEGLRQRIEEASDADKLAELLQEVLSVSAPPKALNDLFADSRGRPLRAGEDPLANVQRRVEHAKANRDGEEP